jgi:glycine cleavage system transcriptional repressor
MRHFALSAVGRDRPGIVASVSAVLLRHGVNVEDSQMTILRGHFTMMLVVAAPDEADADALRADLTDAGRELGLEALLLSDVAELDPSTEAVPSHMVTVYGADHPGILHAAAAAMAERGVDITDLNTRLLGEGGQPVYALMMEVALPPGVEPPELEGALADVAREQGVDVTVRALESEAL